MEEIYIYTIKFYLIKLDRNWNTSISSDDKLVEFWQFYKWK